MVNTLARTASNCDRYAPGAALTTPTAELVDAARRGDREAMRGLYERFAPVVHGCLLAQVHPQEVDDLLQDTFARALASLSTLREAAAFPGWILRIARNLAASAHRRPPGSDEGLSELATTAADGAIDPAGAEVAAVLTASGDADALSLVSLLSRYPALAEGPLLARAQAALPQAPPVDLVRLRTGDATALDGLWDALPYPRAKSWWLHWRDAFAAPG